MPLCVNLAVQAFTILNGHCEIFSIFTPPWPPFVQTTHCTLPPCWDTDLGAGLTLAKDACVEVACISLNAKRAFLPPSPLPLASAPQGEAAPSAWSWSADA